MVVSVALAAVVLVLSFALLPQLFSVANDEDYARTTGLSVRFYNVLISVLAAVTVSVAMRTVGLLLVSALMIIPVATAQQFSRGFRTTMLGAMAAGHPRRHRWRERLGVRRRTARSHDRAGLPGGLRDHRAAGAGGAATPARAGAVPGAGALRGPTPHGTVDEPHRHEHGPGCGHPAVEHGDHVDYIHDGHRHAPHGGHYDEH